jgi:hypothetical protein
MGVFFADGSPHLSCCSPSSACQSVIHPPPSDVYHRPLPSSSLLLLPLVCLLLATPILVFPLTPIVCLRCLLSSTIVLATTLHHHNHCLLFSVMFFHLLHRHHSATATNYHIPPSASPQLILVCNHLLSAVAISSRHHCHRTLHPPCCARLSPHPVSRQHH